MRLHWLALCVATFAFVAIASATSSSVRLPDYSKAAEHTTSTTGLPKARSLRTSTIDEEERAGFSSSTVGKIKTFFSSTKLTPKQQIQAWLTKGESADDVFARMKLPESGSFLLLDNNFGDWLKYVDDFNAKHPAKKTSAITTLTARYGETGLYKLIQDGMKHWRTEEVASKLQAGQIKQWISAGKDPDDVFHLMELNKVKKDLLSSPDFINWVKYVDEFNAKHREHPASMILTLMNYYNDDALIKLTESAMSAKATKTIAAEVQEQLVQFWLKSRKTPDDALVDFGLGKKNTYHDRPLDTLLEKPLFNNWAKYVDAYNIKYPEKKVTMIETLTRRFGDDEVTKMLSTARAKASTRDVAANLESAQLEMWLSSRQSVDDVFKLLKLDYPGVVFQENPLLNTWVAYMNHFVREDPGKASALLPALESRFKDRQLNEIFLVAKKYTSMEDVVAKIQTEKIQSYLASNESPKKVFKLLALDIVGNNVLSDPLLKTWMNYVKDFNKRNPKNQESWFTPISHAYVWFGVERMIETGMQNPNTVKLAKKVEKAWLNHWLDQERTPKSAFELLHLKKAGEETLASPKFKTWEKYLNDFNLRYPKQRESVLDGLRANYYDRGLLRMLNTSKQDPDTEKLATNLQGALVNKWIVEKKDPTKLRRELSDVPTADELINRYIKKLDALSGHNEERARGLSVPVGEKVKKLLSSSKVTPDKLRQWLGEGKSADIVFDRLRLTNAGDLLFLPRSYDKFTQWLKYVDDFNIKNFTKRMSAISTLSRQYDDTVLYDLIKSARNYPETKEVAKRLHTEQMERWVTAAKDPDDVFRLMKLNKVKEGLLSSPELSVWAKYVDDFNAKYPKKPASMVPALLKYNTDDVALFKMTEAAKGMEGTRGIASKLEDQLAQFWLSTRKSPGDVLEDLGLGKKATTYYTSPLDNRLENPLFSGWAKYANAYSKKYHEDKASVIETLTRTFGDENVAKMLVKAKTKDATQSIAMKLESAQLEMWQSSGKSVDEVYELLKLTPTHLIGDFSHQPLLDVWVSYLNTVVMASPSKVSSLFKAAKKFPNLEKAATKLQTEKIQGYLAKNVAPQDVFLRLALKDVGGNLLGDDLFMKWLKYVKEFNKKNPKSRESWAKPILQNHNTVMHIIETAKQNPSTVNLAKALEREQLKYRLHFKDPPVTAFIALELQTTRKHTLASPDFKTWVQYLNAFNRRYPEKKTTMIDVLRAKYHDVDLLEMSAAANKDPKTKKLATDLQGALINKWVATKKSPAGIKRIVNGAPTADEMVERYAKKLNALSGNTS